MVLNMQFRSIKNPPQAHGDTVTNILLNSTRTHNVAYISVAITKLMNEFKLTLPQIENQLRELKTDIFLLAAPKEQCTPNTTPINMQTKEPTPYWIWICVNGHHAATLTMKEFGIVDVADNLKKLEDTGFLVLKEG